MACRAGCWLAGRLAVGRGGAVQKLRALCRKVPDLHVCDARSLASICAAHHAPRFKRGLEVLSPRTRPHAPCTSAACWHEVWTVPHGPILTCRPFKTHTDLRRLDLLCAYIFTLLGAPPNPRCPLHAPTQHRARTPFDTLAPPALRLRCWRFETTQRGRKREHYQRGPLAETSAFGLKN